MRRGLEVDATAPPPGKVRAFRLRVSKKNLKCLHGGHCFVPLPAFSKDCLLNDRWLLGGVPKRSEGIWYEVLLMTAEKQLLFLKRVLFLHSLAKRRATSKSAVLRLAPAEWAFEADHMSVLAHCLATMKTHRNPAVGNALVFPEEVLNTLQQRAIEGPSWHAFVISMLSLF